jgi:hypothetical protein
LFFCAHQQHLHSPGRHIALLAGWLKQFSCHAVVGWRIFRF